MRDILIIYIKNISLPQPRNSNNRNLSNPPTVQFFSFSFFFFSLSHSL